MRALFPILLLGGCISATFHSQTGATPPPVAERAVVVGAADALGAQAQHLGAVDLAPGGDPNAGQDDLLAKATEVAAHHGGTHLVVRAAGTAETDYTTPASETRTCTRDGDTRSCQTTYQPESTGAFYTPYATYDVYRVEPAAWQALPAALRPAAIDPARLTPVGADGGGVTIGWFTQPYPGAASGTSGSVFPTAYTASTSQVNGVWIGASRTHGHSVIAADLGFGGGALDGTATSMEGQGSAAYTQTYSGAALRLRAGLQVGWRYVALAGGVGVGGAVWSEAIPSIDPNARAFVEPPYDTVADFYLPLWATLTIKPSCDWGVQAMASYDERPFDAQASAPSLAIGLIWQPASACR